jgi:hypothetical protein
MAATAMRAEDLAGWHPRIKRPADPRQGDLFAKPPPLVMNVVSWRHAPVDGAVLARTRQQPERSPPVLQVIEGGRSQVTADIQRLAEELREIEQRLADAHEELVRLQALLGGC